VSRGFAVVPAEARVDIDGDQSLAARVPDYGRFSEAQLQTMSAFYEAQSALRKVKAVMDWVLTTKFDVDAVPDGLREYTDTSKVQADVGYLTTPACKTN